MTHEEKLELAREVLDNLYDRVFSDEARVVSLLNIPKASPDALIDEMSNSMRYIGLHTLRDTLQLRSLDKGVGQLIDHLEERSRKRMRELASKFITKDEMSMSEMLRPRRKV
jgi:hypothetical protein